MKLKEANLFPIGRAAAQAITGDITDQMFAHVDTRVIDPALATLYFAGLASSYAD